MLLSLTRQHLSNLLNSLRKIIRTLVGVLVLGSIWVLQGCTVFAERSQTDVLAKQNSRAPAEHAQPLLSTRDRTPSPPIPLHERLALSPIEEEPTHADSNDSLFSFRAHEMPLTDALRLFAQAHRLNIVVSPEVHGTITVDFQGLPLDKAMVALLDSHGYYWTRENGLIRVQRWETRSFTLDYIRLVRSGEGRNKAQITSGSGSVGSPSRDTGEITLNQSDEVKFWEELEDQIRGLMSTEGQLVVNRLSGTIQVTDLHRNVENIAVFLAKIRRTLYRQVAIEARIYEVNLNDNYSLGINWNKIAFDGTHGVITLSNIVTAPFGGFVAKAATGSIAFRDGSFDVILEALQEQGELRVVSQPRVITLNNQPALIKVATDEAFFTQTVAQGAAGTGNIITEQARSVSVGLVLSVTPQVSEDGWIMLDVTPIISRLREIRQSPQNTATAPVVDVKQSSSLVRLRNGDMVIIGGLIQDQVSETKRTVPLLGDIPWLGRLFTGTYTIQTKSELVVFLSAKILDMQS
ncbi:MAG: hypothetical protein D6690_11700 [Nitrospirae bacterium]|nr:MAG: hypothetical protein D6690_11700 [Nitrospirota bacterium]